MRKLLALALLGASLTAQAQAPLKTFTWQEAMDRAKARNPSLLVAQQEIARASAIVREARAGWLPLLNAGGSLTRLDADRLVNGAVTQPINQRIGTLSATVPILAPQAWANDWHAQDNRDLATLNVGQVGRDVAAAVGRAFLTVLLQHRQVEVLTRAVEAARAHYEYAQTRLAGGLGNAIDEARAEQELRSDESAVATARAALVRAQSALAILLSEEGPVDAREEVRLPEPPAADTAVGEARARRPDVRVARERVTANQNLHRDTWVYYAPNLAAVAQAFAGTRTPVQPEKGWQALLVLSIPLFDGGFRYGVGRERKALEAESQVQLDAALRQVSVEVRAAFVAMQQADEALRAAQAASRAANNAAKLAEEAYLAGITNNLELIDAERRARDAGSQAAFAEDAARQARLDLLLASGRFP